MDMSLIKRSRLNINFIITEIDRVTKRIDLSLSEPQRSDIKLRF